MGDNIHAGHRSRMRQRFLETGFAGFPPHEVLEMLLYYGIPRRDTNPLAHKLLAEYGSLHSVLCADPEELCRRLMDMALEKGAHDNVTVVVVAR